MKVYIIIVDKEIPRHEFIHVLMDHQATGQVAELDGADGYNITNV